MNTVTALKWFTFRQNNSGGYFIINETVAPWVFIQAANAQDAANKAAQIFESHSEYCECCGERWSTYLDESDGKNEPLIYDIPLRQAKPNGLGKSARLHHYDGRVETFDLSK